MEKRKRGVCLARKSVGGSQVESEYRMDFSISEETRAWYLGQPEVFSGK